MSPLVNWILTFLIYNFSSAFAPENSENAAAESLDMSYYIVLNMLIVIWIFAIVYAIIFEVKELPRVFVFHENWII